MLRCETLWNQVRSVDFLQAFFSLNWSTLKMAIYDILWIILFCEVQIKYLQICRKSQNINNTCKQHQKGY